MNPTTLHKGDLLLLKNTDTMKDLYIQEHDFVFLTDNLIESLPDGGLVEFDSYAPSHRSILVNFVTRISNKMSSLYIPVSFVEGFANFSFETINMDELDNILNNI